MSIPFPSLPYEMNALEPYMSKQTLEFHYGRHHKNYVDAANDAIEGTLFEPYNNEEIMLRSHNTDPTLFNNSAQAWNHSFFWNCLSPNHEPSSKLIRNLVRSFGTMDRFKEMFSESATHLFGSGWVWLVRDGNHNLVIRALSNADNPIVHGEIPILACDVWEHAYYIDYQNQRHLYLRSFWPIVNWKFVEANLEAELSPLAQTRRPIEDLTTAEEFDRARATHH